MFTTNLRYLCTRDLLGSLVKASQTKTSSLRCMSSVIRCHLPDFDVPNVTIPEFIFKDFGKYPTKAALECAETGRKYTYEEVRRKSINLNKGIRKKFKLRPNDVVALILPNVPEYAVCLLGILQAGLRVTPVSPFGTADEVKRQIEDTNAKAIFTTCQLGAFIQTAVQQLSRSTPIITIKTQVSDAIPPGTINFQELVDTAFDIDDINPSNTHNIAVIPYSSGTTGKHKGVLHSHSTLITSVCAVNSEHVYPIKKTTENSQETTPAVLPFFHIYGLTVGLLLQLHNLVKIITIPKFTPTLFLNSLLKHKPSAMCIVPPIALFMANHPAVTKEHFESLETVYSGAAPLGASDEQKLIKRSGKNLNVFQGYGLTEAPLVTAHYKNTSMPHGSVGKVLQNMELKVVPVENPSGGHLGINQPGELLIKGPQVMLGYYNRPKESADAFLGEWFRSGDLVYFDENNNMFVKDRLKELIKVQGYQVPPAELEELIRTYPNVSDAVVIGIPHEQYGEVPRAYLSVKADTKVNLKHLDEFVASKVAKYKKIIGGFAVVDNIPKTASGKYLRKELKLQYMQELK